MITIFFDGFNRRSSSKPRSAGHAGVEILGVGESKLRHSEDYAEIVDDVEGDYSSASVYINSKSIKI